MSEQDQTKLMFRAEMLGQQMDQIEQQLANADKQAAEVVQLKKAIEEFSALKRGDELFVPLAAGVFTKATFQGDRTLLINVGSGVAVPKTVVQVQGMLDEQVKNVKEYQQQLHAEFEQMLDELQRLQQSFEGK